MLALEDGVLASRVPVGPALALLRSRYNVRGFGFLGVVLSGPRRMLHQNTTLLQIQVRVSYGVRPPKAKSAYIVTLLNVTPLSATWLTFIPLNER